MVDSSQQMAQLERAFKPFLLSAKFYALVSDLDQGAVPAPVEPEDPDDLEAFAAYERACQEWDPGERELLWKDVGDTVSSGRSGANDTLMVPEDGIEVGQIEAWARANGWPHRSGLIKLRRRFRESTIDKYDRRSKRKPEAQCQIHGLSQMEILHLNQLALMHRPKEPDAFDKLMEMMVNQPDLIFKGLDFAENYAGKIARTWQYNTMGAKAEAEKVLATKTELDAQLAEVKKMGAAMQAELAALADARAQLLAAAGQTGVVLPAPAPAAIAPPETKNAETEEAVPAPAQEGVPA